MTVMITDQAVPCVNVLLDQQRNTSVGYCWLTMIADPVSQLAYQAAFQVPKHPGYLGVSDALPTKFRWISHIIHLWVTNGLIWLLIQ